MTLKEFIKQTNNSDWKRFLVDVSEECRRALEPQLTMDKLQFKRITASAPIEVLKSVCFQFPAMNSLVNE